MTFLNKEVVSKAIASIESLPVMTPQVAATLLLVHAVESLTRVILIDSTHEPGEDSEI